MALLYSFCSFENHTFLSRTKLLMRPCASFCKLRYYLAQLYTAAHRCTHTQTDRHTQTDISVVISMIDSSFNSLVSRQASQHILRWSLSPKIRTVVWLWQEGHLAQKYLGVHGWAYSCSRLCGCCRPASSHTVRGDLQLTKGLMNSRIRRV